MEQSNSELMNQYDVKALFLHTLVNNEWLTKLAQWLDQNNIKVNVKKTFSLDESLRCLTPCVKGRHKEATLLL